MVPVVVVVFVVKVVVVVVIVLVAVVVEAGGVVLVSNALPAIYGCGVVVSSYHTVFLTSRLLVMVVMPPATALTVSHQKGQGG